MLLAARSDKEVRSLYASVEAIPNHDSINTLLDVLHRARRDGWVRVVTGRKPTLRATVAVPVGATRYAAIALSGAISAGEAPRYARLLREAAIAIDSASPGSQAE
ncbi:MAG: hypothetical protein QM770_08630 [Tepidisphaeraceae bacterium]